MTWCLLSQSAWLWDLPDINGVSCIDTILTANLYWLRSQRVCLNGSYEWSERLSVQRGCACVLMGRVTGILPLWHTPHTLSIRMISGIARNPLLVPSGALVCSIRADWRATQKQQRSCHAGSFFSMNWQAFMSLRKNLIWWLNAYIKVSSRVQ